MSAKRKLLTTDEYRALAQNTREWSKVDLQLGILNQTPGIQRKDDLLGAISSGDAHQSKLLNGHKAILGMDVIVYERHPKFIKGEWDVNVYHYVVITTGRIDLPYCLCGPYTKETLMGHWPQCLDMTPYED